MLGYEARRLRPVVRELPGRVVDRIGRDAAAAAAVVEAVPVVALLARPVVGQHFERLAREVADLRLRGTVDLERADPTVRVDGDGACTGRAAGGRRGGEDEDGQPLHNLSMGAIIGLCA